MRTRRLRLRAAGRARSPSTPIEPRDAARLLVDRGPRPAARAPPRPRPARAPRARRPAGRQRLAGDPGPPAPAPAPREARSRCSCSSRSATDRWEALARPGPQARRRASACSTPTATAGGRDRRSAPRPATPSQVASARPGRGRTHRRDAAAAVHHRAARRRRALPDRLRRPARVGRRADGRAPPHRRAPGRTGSPSGDRAGPGRADGRARHVQADRGRRPARSPDPHRALPRARRDPGRGAAAAQRVVAVGTTAVRALETRRGHRAARRAQRPVHPPALRLAGRRSCCSPTSTCPAPRCC